MDVTAATHDSSRIEIDEALFALTDCERLS